MVTLNTNNSTHTAMYLVPRFIIIQLVIQLTWITIITTEASNVPLLIDNGPVSDGAIIEEQQNNKNKPVENSPENHEDKRDAKTDVKEELCDLSILSSV